MKKLLLFLLLFFVIGLANAQTPIYRYDFNGSLADVNGTNTLTQNPTGVTYVTDRNGNSNGAINLVDRSLSTTLANLPQGNTPRTVSFWYKSNFTGTNTTDTNWMFVYGSASNGFGLYNEVLLNLGFVKAQSRNYTYVVANNIDNPLSSEPIAWHHYVVVHGFQGVANRGVIFVDGVLKASLDRPTALTTSGTNFVMGKEFGSPTDINVLLDDFQIFDTALTASQITALYNATSASAPTITNVSATPASTSAQINYTLNANNDNTISVVKYGLTSGNLSSSVLGNSASGTTPVSTPVSLTGLTANTTYFYRVEASNNIGSAFSTIGSFTTSTTSTATLPVITNVSVSSLIHEGANIAYTVNAGGATTNTTVLYDIFTTANNFGATGTTATGTTNTACTAITQYSSTPSQAPPGTTIYYKVQASNSAGDAFSPVYTYTQVAKPTYILQGTSNITTTSITIAYTLFPNGGNSTSVIKYGTTLGNYPNTATGFTALGFTSNYSDVGINFLTPNTTYYYIIEGTNAYGVSQSTAGTFTTQGNAPTLSAISASNITQTTATINFSINTGGSSTTTMVNYDTDPDLDQSVSGPTVNTNVATSYSINLTGLLPNTTYYYSVFANNSNGTAASNVTQFTTLANVPFPNPIYNFEFNNNLVSQDGTTTLGPFVGGSTAYVSNGTVANGALQVNDARAQNTLSAIPLGASSRSVHMRLRFASGALSTENFIFNWGTGVTGQAFAYHQTAGTAKLLGWGGSGYDYATIPSSGANFGVWYEYVFTYNGTTMSVYRDGVLLGSTPATLNTIGDTFRIGVSNTGIQKLQADIDYIRIFNQALTTSQVSSLYANPALSNDVVDANSLKFSLYPNPANDILNIAMDEELKSVEIYSLQGQKVITAKTNQINISNLAKGMYLVKIENNDGDTATKKLIVK